MPCIICQCDHERKKFTHLGADFFECGTCGLVRTLPFPSPEQIAAHYQEKSCLGNYAIVRSQMADYREVYRTYVKLLRRHCGSLSGRRILDVGCFTGDFLDMLQGPGAITHGIELQPEAAAVAAQKHPGRIFNGPFEAAEWRTPFDVVTLFGLLEHLANPEVLRECLLRWLRPGGFLLVQTPDAASLPAKLLGRLWPPYLPVEHLHYFSRQNIGRFLRERDYEIVRIMRHVKRLRVDYVYRMLHVFGPHFLVVFGPLYRFLPEFLRRRKLPFYVGEMILVARRMPGGGGPL